MAKELRNIRCHKQASKIILKFSSSWAMLSTANELLLLTCYRNNRNLLNVIANWKLLFHHDVNMLQSHFSKGNSISDVLTGAKEEFSTSSHAQS